MQWPEKPTCHGSDANRYNAAAWRDPDPTNPPYGRTFRTCAYCGSIHPGDLVGLLEAGARLGGSDWKYGWPHKFYVYDIPNPLAGQEVEMGSRSRVENGIHHSEPILGPAPATQQGKWYNSHLTDEGYDAEAREKLLKHLSEGAGITFFFEEGKLAYKAPYAGFQK